MSVTKYRTEDQTVWRYCPTCPGQYQYYAETQRVRVPYQAKIRVYEGDPKYRVGVHKDENGRRFFWNGKESTYLDDDEVSFFQEAPQPSGDIKEKYEVKPRRNGYKVEYEYRYTPRRTSRSAPRYSSYSNCGQSYSYGRSPYLSYRRRDGFAEWTYRRSCQRNGQLRGRPRPRVLQFILISTLQVCRPRQSQRHGRKSCVSCESSIGSRARRLSSITVAALTPASVSKPFSPGGRRPLVLRSMRSVRSPPREYVAKAGLSDRIRIVRADATKIDVKADAGVAYLWPDVLQELKPKLTKLKRFVTRSHMVPELVMSDHKHAYLWKQSAAPVRKTVAKSKPRTSKPRRQPSGVHSARDSVTRSGRGRLTPLPGVTTPPATCAIQFGASSAGTVDLVRLPVFTNNRRIDKTDLVDHGGS